MEVQWSGWNRSATNNTRPFDANTGVERCRSASLEKVACDLYVWCANASDGIVTAQPYMNKGKQLRDIKGKHGAPFGETIMQNATEGTIKETTYWWPRPGADEPFEKETFYTKVGDQICGVGYYKK